MTSQLLPSVLLLAAVGTLGLVRSRQLPTQVATEAVLLLALGGWLLNAGSSPLPAPGQIAHRADGAWLQAVAGIWWLVGARLVVTLVTVLRGRSSHSREARLVSDLVSGAIYLSAAFIILNSILDLPVRGLLATSGVIAIVVGLALQSTLADLFSGIAVGLEQSIHLGDNISVAEAAEGVVIQMNWRSVHLRTVDADVATIPNSIMAKSRIVNHSKPTERRATTTDLDFWLDAPVSRALELVRNALLLCPAILQDPPPVVSLKAAKRRHVVVAVAYSVARSPLLTSARSELLQNFLRMQRHDVASSGSPPAVDFLREVVLFETLGADQLARVAAAIGTKELHRGEVLFEAGTSGESVFIVRSGIFDVAKPDGGMQRLLGRIGPGEYIGELGMVTGAPRQVSVTALTSAVIYELGKEPLQALLQEDEGLGRALERSVRRGLDLIERDAAARAGDPGGAAGNVFERLVRFLRR